MDTEEPKLLALPAFSSELSTHPESFSVGAIRVCVSEAPLQETPPLQEAAFRNGNRPYSLFHWWMGILHCLAEQRREDVNYQIISNPVKQL